MAERRKNLILPVLLLIVLFILIGCSGGDLEEYPPDSEELTITEAVNLEQTQDYEDNFFESETKEYKEFILYDFEELMFVEAANLEQTQGYETTVKTKNAEYFFEGGTKKENTELVQHAELIFWAAKQYYKIVNYEILKIYFTNDTAKTHMSTLKLVINPNDAVSSGMLFYYVSGKKLPAWLCVGLEYYWLNRYGFELSENVETDKEINIEAWRKEVLEKELPDFGDVWFMPSLIEDDLKGKVSSIAYAFVKYLEETKQLNDMISDYTYLIEDRVPKAEAVRVEAWNTFNGSRDLEFADDFVYQYFFNWYSTVSNNDAVFSVAGREGIYYFDRYDWELDTVIYYVDINERSIKYVKDWFGYVYDQPIPVILYSKHRAGMPWGKSDPVYGQLGYYIYLCADWPPLPAAHEAVHTLTSLMGERMGFYVPIENFILEEGLCNIVSYQFLAENRKEGEMYIERYKNDSEMELTAIDEYYNGLLQNPRLVEFYNKIDTELLASKVRWWQMVVNLYDWYYEAEYTSDRIHKYLMDICNYGAYEDILLSESSDVPLKVYSLYETSTSFAMYLYNKGTKEDFRKVYSNILMMEEVYGESFDTIFAEWIEFIKDNYNIFTE